jgi:hypothetical protein
MYTNTVKILNKIGWTFFELLITQSLHPKDGRSGSVVAFGDAGKNHLA